MTAANFPKLLRSHYLVRKLLGSGSFGHVYEVERISDGEVVALKTFPAGSDLARVKRELLGARDLDHPHLIRSFATGVEGGEAYLEMEPAEGSLRDWLRAAKAGEEAARARTWEALRSVALGLAELRRQGWTHRDMKPENVLLVEGVAKISDFGLTRGGDLKTLTAAGMILGTPRYMAPEQARGEAPSPAGDVFALGVMFVELLEGEVPWDTGVSTETLMRVARGELAPLPRTSAALAPHQFQLLSSCLELDPERRPTNLEAFHRDLGELSNELAAPPSRAATRVQPAGKLKPAEGNLDTSAVRVAPPSAEPPRPPPSFSWRRAGFGLLLMAAVFGPTTQALRAPPPPQPDPSPASTGPSRPEVSVSRDTAPVDSLRGDLEVAAGRFTDPVGRIHEEEDWLPEFRSLTDGDPARWGELVDAVPSLAQSLHRLRSAPRDRQLTTQDRQTWEAADKLFSNRGIAPPFAPLLPEVPASAPTIAAANADLARIEAVFLARAGELSANSDSVPQAVRDQIRALNVFGGTNPVGPLKLPKFFWASSEIRQDFVDWLDTEALSRRFFQVGYLALREESSDGEDFACRTWHQVATQLGAFAGGALDLPVSQLFPGLEPKRVPPATALFAAAAAKANIKLRQAANEEIADAYELYLQLLERACQTSQALPLAAQQDRLRLASTFWIRWYTKGGKLEIAQAVLLRLSRDPAFAEEFDHLAHSSVELLERLTEAPARLVTGPEQRQLFSIFKACVDANHQRGSFGHYTLEKIRPRLRLFDQ